jgi:hypothetical protein
MIGLPAAESWHPRHSANLTEVNKGNDAEGTCPRKRAGKARADGMMPKTTWKQQMAAEKCMRSHRRSAKTRVRRLPEL